MWIARDRIGTLGIYIRKPNKHTKYGFWGPIGHNALFIDSNLFPEVKWEDDEPVELELVIKRKKT